jgi:hypothetical protein
MSKGVAPEGQQELRRMGREGWELVSVIPLAVGAVGGQWVDSAICFLKRPLNVRKIVSDSAAGTTGEMLSGDEFDLLLYRANLVDRISASPGFPILDSEDWKRITTEPCPEALPEVWKYVLADDLVDEKRESVYCFHAQLTHADRIRSAYQLARSGKKAGRELGLELIRRFQLWDSDSIEQLLRDEHREARSIGLAALFALKPSFEEEDIQRFRRLRERVILAFPPAVIREKKSMLGGAKREWACQVCGKAWPETNIECECGYDMHGAHIRIAGKFQDALARLDRRITILQQEFEKR